MNENGKYINIFVILQALEQLVISWINDGTNLFLNRIYTWLESIVTIHRTTRFPFCFGILLGSMLRFLRSTPQLCWQRSRLFQCAFSTSESELRIRCHIENIQDLSIPYVLIESSFLSRCELSARF